MTGYVGDYQKHWSNVHCFFQSNDFVLTTVRIWSTGADMDVDGFMNSLVKIVIMILSDKISVFLNRLIMADNESRQTTNACNFIAFR